MVGARVFIIKLISSWVTSRVFLFQDFRICSVPVLFSDVEQSKCSVPVLFQIEEQRTEQEQNRNRTDFLFQSLFQIKKFSKKIFIVLSLIISYIISKSLDKSNKNIFLCVSLFFKQQNVTDKRQIHYSMGWGSNVE